VIALTLVGALVVATRWRQTTAGRAPSIVVILIDTLRADRLSSYGHDAATSPFLDRLAAEGVRFENVFAAAPTTFPSVSSLFTSRSPVEFHTPEARELGIPGEFVTVAEVLRQHGYETGAVSGNPIVRRHPGTGDDRADGGFDQGFEHFDEQCSARTLEDVAPHSAPCITERALAMLDGFGEGPFFLYVHYLDPHHPYAPPPEWDRFTGPYTGPWYIKRGLTGPIMWWLYDGGEDPHVDADDIRHLQGLYDGEIRSVDANVQRLSRWFTDRGRDTLFVVVSDHGESLMEHRQMGHGASLYQTEVAVPLIFHWRARWEKGEIRRDLACTIDVMPTILDLVGLPVPETARGRALFADGAPRDAERACFAAGRMNWETMDAALFGVRIGNDKMIYDPVANRSELYDLGSDPGEAQDLATGGGASPRAEALREAMAAALRDARPGGDRHRPIDPALKRALEALGYMR
jgi:arylsulfatase A-like enzyme